MSYTLIILFGSFLTLLIFSVPITFSIGVSALFALLIDGKVPLQLIPQRLFISLDSFTLLAIPLFIIAGDIMMIGGISKRLVNLAKVMVGWMSGGLVYVTFVASAMFGAISGSSVATCTAIGGMMYPELVKDGYEDAFSAAACATSGTLGVLIPPSIAFLLFGTVTNTSVSDLFFAGAVVGIIGMFGYCIAVFFHLRAADVKPAKTKKPTFREVLFAIKDAFWGILSPVIILGGIYSGKFTPTEAAVVSIVYSIIICSLIYRELHIKDIVGIFIKSGATSGIILLLSGISQVFSWVVATNGLVRTLTSTINTLELGLWGFLLIINLILLVLGMLMETPPIIILTAPIFLPLAVGMGMDPIHFAAMMVFNLIYGAITPPFGLNVFVANAYSKHLPVTTIFSACKPFYIVGAIMILFITYVPLIFK